MTKEGPQVNIENEEKKPKDLNEAMKIISDMKDKYKYLSKAFRGVTYSLIAITSLASAVGTYKWNNDKEKDARITENLKKMQGIIFDAQNHFVSPGGKEYIYDNKKVYLSSSAEFKENIDIDPVINKLDYLVNITKNELDLK
ncbi:MAG: hypothetical protein US50_C0001G0018 [Candidatus Nomurabacteria bacterium GW2011_GWB1_37_5]|uniref:Uncharacterized protein n=1 Tax=Candidatus Nomurabacteria bacterium GW2011_GWB1_37_5 TaxID=1618742 RepID=A0A0G0K5T8_9BACT|nr:MAG: hypothetical protein US50_C0001G0018 [Candidatus Nomurabacteria bacterium GW2011_GWB1_37_5]